MRAAKTIALVAVLLGVSALGAHRWLRPTPAPAADSDVRAELEQLRGELRSVSAAQGAALGALARGASVRPGTPAPSAPAAPPAAVAAVTAHPAMDGEALLKEENRRAHEGVERLGEKLDGVLAADTVDTAWLSDTSRAVDGLFAKVPNSKVRSTECGSRLCRVVVEQPSVEDLRGLAGQIAGTPPFDQDVLYRYDLEATPPHVTLYVTRAGTEMASLVKPAS